MPSTKTELTPDFPRNLVLGANSRIGGMLRRAWTDRPVTWQARQGGPGLTQLNPLEDAAALHRLTADHDVVLCLAGVVAPAARLADNSALALATIRASAATSLPHVFLFSTAAVYGRPTDLCREDAVPRPISPYGMAKWEMEQAALAEARRLNVPATILRVGNVAGADAILGGWRPGFLLDRFPDGTTPQRSYIGPFALAAVLEDLLRNRSGLPEVLNLALPGRVGMSDLLDAAGLAWTPQPAGGSTLPRVELDTTRLTRHLTGILANATATDIVADWQRWTKGEAPK